MMVYRPTREIDLGASLAGGLARPGGHLPRRHLAPPAALGQHLAGVGVGLAVTGAHRPVDTLAHVARCHTRLTIMPIATQVRNCGPTL